MSESSKQARDQLLRLISESMEARMQGFETLQQLQSTMKAIHQLRASPWPDPQADMRDDSFPDPMVTAESLHSYRAATLPVAALQPVPPDPGLPSP